MRARSIYGNDTTARTSTTATVVSARPDRTKTPYSPRAKPMAGSRAGDSNRPSTSGPEGTRPKASARAGSRQTTRHNPVVSRAYQTDHARCRITTGPLSISQRTVRGLKSRGHRSGHDHTGAATCTTRASRGRTNTTTSAAVTSAGRTLSCDRKREWGSPCPVRSVPPPARGSILPPCPAAGTEAPSAPVADRSRLDNDT